MRLETRNNFLLCTMKLTGNLYFADGRIKIQFNRYSLFESSKEIFFSKKTVKCFPNRSYCDIYIEIEHLIVANHIRGLVVYILQIVIDFWDVAVSALYWLAFASNFTFVSPSNALHGMRSFLKWNIYLEIAKRITSRGGQNDNGHDNHPLISILCHNLCPDKSNKKIKHKWWYQSGPI